MRPEKVFHRPVAIVGPAYCRGKGEKDDAESHNVPTDTGQPDIKRLCRNGAVGEICGRFYNKDGQECDPEYRDRVISIRLEELRQVPDVIGVTNGTGRVEAIYVALKTGLIKSIIIDEAGATAVLASAQL